MAGLVAYASSDEEDEVLSQPEAKVRLCSSLIKDSRC
jgi:hypothetical protein